MAASDNSEWIYVAHPTGVPKLDECFRLQSCEVPICGDGQLLLRPVVVSVDPYLRGRMAASHGYLGAWQLGSPPTSIAVCEVIASKSSEHAVGDHVLFNETPWRRISAVDATARLVKIPAADGFPLRLYASALGMPGLTAFFSERELATPKAGNVAFVSGAAGAVGSMVGQLLKMHGCRVIGSAGSDDKVEFVRSLGFDAVFNYKTTDTRTALREAAPEGIDIYYDNVGGETLDISLELMRPFGRVVLCGSISQYNSASKEERYGVKNLSLATVKNLRLEGFLVGRWASQFAEGRAAMATLVKEGKLIVKDTVVKGFDAVPGAFLAMLRGENTGKMVVEV